MKKNYKDYTSFKLDKDDILWEARMRCMKEMYAKAQPSANYDEIYEYYKTCKKEGKEPEKIYLRYYLSQEEFEYIRNKYIEAYRIRDEFKDHCDIIIRDMEEGCNKDKWIPERTDEYGTHPGYRGFEAVPSLAKQIGEEHAKVVIDFIKDRKDYYRFNRDEERFSFDICLTDSPNSSEEAVKKYWKEQGQEIEIDPRHWKSDDFWCEDNGYIDDEEEYESLSEE